MSSVIYHYPDDFASISKPNSMKLDEQSISKFKVVKQFSEKNRINSVDFSEDGNFMLTSSDDDTIRLYNCEKGLKDREIFSKKYGADLITFTHAARTAIHTSTKENDFIRYLSLHDNKYLKYFIGHEKRVVFLALSPPEDFFLSGSLDNTVRIWDIRKDKPQIARLPLEGSTTGPVGNYDPEGLIFAIGLNNEMLKLYDVRNYDKGPFSTIKYAQRGKWHSLKFSPNGKQMLITTDREELLVLDAFTGETLHRLQVGPQMQPGKALAHPCEASYSVDSQFIMTGSEDGCLHVWSASRGNKVTTLTPPRQFPAEPVQCVKFNPKYMMIGSACSKMSFWIPEENPYR